MFFWAREIVGWLMLALSLLLVRVALQYLENRQVVEAGVVVALVIAFLRMGILLIRVSTAARIARNDDN
jgi:hypothetical protein